MRHLFLILFTLVCLSSKSYAAEQWVESDQNSCSAVFALGENNMYSYSAHIEYPDYITADKSDQTEYPDEPSIELHITGQSEQSYAIVQFGTTVRTHEGLKQINSCKVVLDSIPKMAYANKAHYAEQSVLSSGRWVKIAIRESGIYQLTHQQIRSMGFSDPDKVCLYGNGGCALPEQQIGDCPDDLRQIPLYREGSRILFWAQGIIEWVPNGTWFKHNVNPYSNYGYYFLTDADLQQNAVFEKYANNLEETSVISEYCALELYEKDQYAWYRSGRKLYEETDFSTLAGNENTYNIKTPNATGNGIGTVRVCFSDDDPNASGVNISINNNSVGRFTIPSIPANAVASENTGYFSFDAAHLAADNRITLKHNAQVGTHGHLDYIELAYQARLSLESSMLQFRFNTAVNGQRLKFEKADANTVILQKTSDNRYISIDFTLNNDTLLTQAVSAENSDMFVAFKTNTTYPAPQVIGEIPNQNLHGIKQADMVIIVPESGRLTSAANRLAAMHVYFDSITAVVVRADQIYNEFSSGTPDATAYRRFMKMLYDRAGSTEQRPQYLLLFGDGAWDNRMLSKEWKTCNPKDYLLCFESENSLNKSTSYVLEDYFGFLQDNNSETFLTDIPDIGIGRIPVVTKEDADAVVDKLYNYMNGNNNAAWCTRLLFLGDDGDDNMHMSHAEYVATNIEKSYPEFTQKKIFWDSYKAETTASGLSYPGVRSDILSNLNQGVLLVNYSGHGNDDYLSHELVLKKQDFLESKTKNPPLWITASCDIAPFDNSADNIGEAALLNPDGGAIALLSTTRTVYAHLNKPINNLFSTYVLKRHPDGSYYTFGQALKEAKKQLVTGDANRDLSENKFHYILLGDPAMRLAVPKEKVILDSVNQTVCAGQTIHISGHIEYFDGTEDSLFSGTISTQLFDSKDLVRCLNNAGAADTAFSYYDRKNRLFSGMDSVKNGRFSIDIPVGLDINYTGNNGALYFYAKGQNDAIGYCQDIKIQGTSQEIKNDTVGPWIWLYLNTPDFSNGDVVHSTPLLVAEMKDSSGINLGSSVGHDIIAIVDNDPSMTYILNDYYQPVIGDYTQGKVVYKMPEIPEGKHKLMLRAWDTMNNSKSVVLDFTVNPKQNPSIIKLEASPNPAHGSTTFYLYHNRDSEEVDVRIEIFDSAGKTVDTIEGIVTSGSCTAEWNFSQIGLRPGIYIYRAVIKCKNGTHTSESSKLIVL